MQPIAGLLGVACLFPHASSLLLFEVGRGKATKAIEGVRGEGGNEQGRRSLVVKER